MLIFSLALSAKTPFGRLFSNPVKGSVKEMLKSGNQTIEKIIGPNNKTVTIMSPGSHVTWNYTGFVIKEDNYYNGETDCKKMNDERGDDEEEQEDEDDARYATLAFIRENLITDTKQKLYF